MAFKTFMGLWDRFQRVEVMKIKTTNVHCLIKLSVSAYCLHVNAMKKAVLKGIWLDQVSWTDSWGSQVT